MASNLERPLAGIRVIDQADENGELCGRLLADLGAEVIRVEPPGGAASRRMPPFHGDTSLYFTVRNLGKKSVTLDMQSAEGRRRLDAMLDAADVWIESHRANDLNRREILERHPRTHHHFDHAFRTDGAVSRLRRHRRRPRRDVGIAFSLGRAGQAAAVAAGRARLRHRGHYRGVRDGRGAVGSHEDGTRTASRRVGDGSGGADFGLGAAEFQRDESARRLSTSNFESARRRSTRCIRARTATCA